MICLHHVVSCVAIAAIAGPIATRAVAPLALPWPLQVGVVVNDVAEVNIDSEAVLEGLVGNRCSMVQLWTSMP